MSEGTHRYKFEFPNLDGILSQESWTAFQEKKMAELIEEVTSEFYGKEACDEREA